MKGIQMGTSLIDEYEVDEIRQFVNDSRNYKEVLKRIGYTNFSGNTTKTLQNYLKKHNISTDHFQLCNTKRTLTKEDVFCDNSQVNQSVLRRWYKKYKNPTNCNICGIPTIWNEKYLELTLDHINGNNHDNRLENLRWVCPNCNSQLDTTNARNPNHKKHYCEKCGKLLQDNQSSLCEICSGA